MLSEACCTSLLFRSQPLELWARLRHQPLGFVVRPLIQLTTTPALTHSIDCAQAHATRPLPRHPLLTPSKPRAEGIDPLSLNLRICILSCT
jgi:hypothetical protein